MIYSHWTPRRCNRIVLWPCSLSPDMFTSQQGALQMRGASGGDPSCSQCLACTGVHFLQNSFGSLYGLSVHSILLLPSVPDCQMPSTLTPNLTESFLGADDKSDETSRGEGNGTHLCYHFNWFNTHSFPGNPEPEAS